MQKHESICSRRPKLTGSFGFRVMGGPIKLRVHQPKWKTLNVCHLLTDIYLYQSVAEPHLSDGGWMGPKSATHVLLEWPIPKVPPGCGCFFQSLLE